MRRAGILLPITSLPSPYGIGCFSKEAYDFVDFLASAGQSYWQILPLGPTGYGDSPYQSFSTFAGNPYFIDLTDLVKRGWLTAAECKKYDFGSDPTSIDYEKIYNARFKALRKAFDRSRKTAPATTVGAGLALPAERNISPGSGTGKPVLYNGHSRPPSPYGAHIDDYALFMAIKDAYGGVSWHEWPDPIRLRQPLALEEYRLRYQKEIAFYRFQQELFREQWLALKAYANGKGIKIIGDIPIYVALDSADSWARPELFQFDKDLLPTGVAGCPPDAFTADGQLWGNPLYAWDYHQKTGYKWWLQRIEYCFTLYDVVRIDHFRGFDAYYNIPYGAVNARKGKWERGPGYELFRTLKQTLGEKEIIAEDLGFLTPRVLRLVKKTGYPGMKILQFGFDSEGDSDYMPHHIVKNSIVYTGTHDNDTVLGWHKALRKEDREFCHQYLNLDNRRGVEWNWEFVRAALASPADLAIIPMQDYLGLGSKARINTPSTVGNNWQWRMEKTALTPELAGRIKEMTKLYRRMELPKKPVKKTVKTKT
jgi:4-alpha-glucanotransferase